MDLNYDWRGFQSVFYPAKRLTQKQHPAFVIHTDGKVDQAFTRTEDLQDWKGREVKELEALWTHRKIVSIGRAQLLQMLSEVAHEGATEKFACQVDRLRSMAQTRLGWDLSRDVTRNFLLSGVQSWWKNILPKRFALLLQVEGNRDRIERFMLAYQKGRIDGMIEPDLTHVVPDRLVQDRGVAQSAHERYGYPVIAFFVPMDRWLEWSQDPSPWWPFLRAMLSGEVRFKTSGLSQTMGRLIMTGLIGMRALFGI